MIYVDRHRADGAELTMRTYGHVVDEFADAPRLSAEDAIVAARRESVRLPCVQGERA